MYQNLIDELPKLEQERYENILDVYKDKDDYYFYNLIQQITLPSNLPELFFDSYTVAPNDTFPFISYKVFKTINLWWLICLANNIQNPTVQLEPGILLKIPKLSIIREILKQINSQDGNQ
jgi:hypothetical protein